MLYTQLSTLYGLSSKGKLKEWTIAAKQETPDHALLVTAHGYVNGKKQHAEKKVLGKNIGKSNATTHFEQAVKNATSVWKKKYAQNYRESTKELVDLPLLPMLALKYKDRSHDIKWPAFVQPKLNGVRCTVKKLEDGSILYLSKTGKKWLTLDFMSDHIATMLDVGEELDGEIYNPDLTFEGIAKRVKRVKSSRADIQKDPLQFHIFDIIQEDVPFEERNRVLTERYMHYLVHGLQSQQNSPLVLVQTEQVETEADFLKYHTIFTSQRYEGTMLRNANGLYVPDYRSADLQKYKDFQDDEFEIVGGHEGEGRDENTVVFECITKEGKGFDARPKGSWERRHLYYVELPNLIGEMLTVRFQNYSDDGKPIFPVGTSVECVIRDYE